MKLLITTILASTFFLSVTGFGTYLSFLTHPCYILGGLTLLGAIVVGSIVRACSYSDAGFTYLTLEQTND